MSILITGGAGYIDSHMAHRLVSDGRQDLLTLDSLQRGRRQAVPSGLTFIQDDRTDIRHLTAILRREAVTVIVHFAGLPHVAESVAHPARYFEGNTARSATLIRAAAERGVEALVYSSTAAVYGEPSQRLIPEPPPSSRSTPTVRASGWWSRCSNGTHDAGRLAVILQRGRSLIRRR